MACMHNTPVEQITSEETKNILPADTINLLWYIWETECNCDETVFNLTESSEAGKQDITVSVNNTVIKSFSVALDRPVNTNVSITIPRNRFVMDIKKQD